MSGIAPAMICFPSEYISWRTMKNRCLNKNYHDYCRYGGKGITIDPKWMDFKNFLNDMGLKSSPNLTLERINNDGNYEPGNCKWATKIEQSRNRKSTILNQEKADRIRELWKTTNYSHKEISKIFDISRSHVTRIINHIYWEK